MDANTFDEEQAEKELEEQEAYRSVFTEWMTHEPDGQTIITDRFDDLHVIERLEVTAKQLASTAEMPTKMVTDQSGRKFTVLTKTGKDVMALCRLFDPYFSMRHGHHVFNPWIRTMLAALCHWCGGDEFGQPQQEIGIVPADRINLDRIVRFVRKVCRSRVFERILKNDKRLARQNFRSACAYLISLFARYSRLLILRIDVYYKGEGKAWARTEEAKAAFERFLRQLRNGRIVPDVLGCLHRREEGPERGIHFHILVVMDGHKRKDAHGHTEAIGRRWVEHYTGRERGTYFNCYAHRRAYRFNGLGLVHLSDWRKLLGLRIALRYITKPEYRVKVKGRASNAGATEGRPTKSAGKSFRRGNFKRDDVKLGARRKLGHEMATVLRILGPTRT